MDKKETRKCQNCQENFVIELEDFSFYERIKVPPPTFCPTCREERRIAIRNERSLYKRDCDLCGKRVVCRTSPDKPYPMYCNKCWWGDGWDPILYGREYDFSRPFFEQFHQLLKSVPHFALGGTNNVNSEWVNQETDDKNCYLNVGGHFNEDSAYNTYEIKGKNCFDNSWILNSELCYENINCNYCYKTLFSQDCNECQNTALSIDCKNCSNIFGCAGLRNKKYYIFNEQVTEGKFESFIKSKPLSSISKIKEMKNKTEAVWLSIPRRENLETKSSNVSGNYISESKNIHNAWFAEKAEDSKNLYIAGWLKDSYDGSSVGWGELCYEMAHTVGVYEGKFNAFSFGGKAESRQSSYLEYCMMCGTSNNLLGCIGLRNKEYCILNKQYPKEEYELLVPKIKKHMVDMPYMGKKGRIYRYGEFFPIEISPFGYNETAAMDYYPLSKEDALEKGYPWSEYETERDVKFSDYKIPEDITDTKEDILENILKCEISGRPYRIIPMELDFYRRMNLPIPRRSPLQRHQDRMKKLLPRKLFKRQCNCGRESIKYQNTTIHFHNEKPCPREIKTPYSPERPEIVYCKECYQSEII